MSDLIDRQVAIEALGEKPLAWTEGEYELGLRNQWQSDIDALKALPSAQPEKRTEKRTETHACDLISRQAAIDAVNRAVTQEVARWSLQELPSAQPGQRCVNCGRTANNGGRYKDGGTRCPIEEHYALPVDGYCHLWEKIKVWEDDYVKRPEEGEK